ncbi:UDP-N-acetylmuramoyl-tripeptide--D-alanyl-D-alanine ligase [Leptotrichia sp.]|uniref:UDP-N-acetylmuramoyl-tripeptide--D-alanyl-D- alanine ligase n=1 Tax=Leptotrichia sp. TaxID=104608 RepID=UPI0017D8071B|nr:UDP-N-acetylmuramoyl-tripeptide--D-alanyl-D-alanine ligase [Leptotrichia sp.]MBB1534510.1 UDP-N-acetylmuramoyl-tripeptide--D-alanyl-D-alanine ligase [Leptotrichia sp.]
MNKSKVFCNIFLEKNIDFDENEIKIKRVCMNSQEVEKDDLFVAIRGGNNFVNEALEKGAVVVYDKKDLEIEGKYRKKAFWVQDSVEFLQEYAKKWRENLKDLKVIGITGSNGKTTVKDMIYQLMSTKYKGKKTEGNYNNHIGLPFTLLRAEESDEFMILEMGMSGFGEIDLLGKISNPDVGVITNIGESHLEFLKTKENVFKAKTELVPYVKNAIIINGDDFYLKNLTVYGINLVKALSLKENQFKDKTRDFYYGDIRFNESGTKFSLKYFGQKCGKTVERNYETNILGEHNILNLTMAIAVVKQFGMEDKYIEEAIKNIALTNMRFQIIEKGTTTYINDAYNASPMSMEKSLETFSKIYNDGDVKVLVLADMLELGDRELELHQNIYYTIEKTKFDKLYLYGERMRSLYDKVKENMENGNLKGKEVEHFSDKKAIKARINEIKDKKVVLIKGSRGMKLEEVIE